MQVRLSKLARRAFPFAVFCPAIAFAQYPPLAALQTQWSHNSIEAANAAVYTPDGTKIIVAGFGGIQIFDAKTNSFLRYLAAPFTYNGTMALAPDGKTLVVGATALDNTPILETWNILTGKRIASLDTKSAGINLPGVNIKSLIYSADGKTLAVGGYFNTPAYGKGFVQLWDAVTNKFTQTLPTQDAQVAQVAFSKDGKTLVDVGTTYETKRPASAAVVEVWDTGAMTLTHSFSAFDIHGTSVALSPDNKTLVFGGYGEFGSASRGILQTWDYAKGKKLKDLTVDFEQLVLAFSPDGKTFANAGGGDTSQLRDATGAVIAEFPNNSVDVTALAFSPDSHSLIATGAGHGFYNAAVATLQVISVPTGTPIATLNPSTVLPSTIAFSPNGQTLVTGGFTSPDTSLSYRSTLSLWNSSDGTPVTTQSTTLQNLGSGVQALTYSPDGTTLVDSGISLNSRTQKTSGLIEIRDGASGVLQRTMTSACDFDLGAVAISADGKTLVTGGTKTGTDIYHHSGLLEFWDLSTGKLLAREKSANLNGVTAFSLSPDGKTLAVVGLKNVYGSLLEFWDVAKHQVKQCVMPYTMGDIFNCVSYLPGGQIVAIGSTSTGSTNLSFWYVPANGYLYGQYLAGGTGVNSLAVSPDGKALYATSNHLFALDISTRQVIGWYNTNTSNTIAISPNGRQVAVSSPSTGITVAANPLFGSLSPARVLVSPTKVTGGTTATGTIQLAKSAPAGGNWVSLASSDPNATVPAFAFVPEGAKTVTFPIQTIPVVTAKSITISATSNGTTSTAPLTVEEPLLTSIAINSASVYGGQNTLGHITMNGPGPNGGIKVFMSSSNPAVTTAAWVLFGDSNSNTAEFDLTTTPVAVTTTVTITATQGSIVRTMNFTVKPPALQALTVSPTTVQGSDSTMVTGTATLTSPAPAGGTVVTITSSKASVAGVPVHLTIPAGAKSATFTVTHAKVTTDTPVTIKATAGGLSQTATLTLTP